MSSGLPENLLQVRAGGIWKGLCLRLFVCVGSGQGMERG